MTGGFEFKINDTADSDEVGGGDNILTTKNITLLFNLAKHGQL